MASDTDRPSRSDGSPAFPSAISEVADALVARLGPPDVGILAGSGFSALAGVLETGEPVPPTEIPAYPRGRALGHGGGISAAVRREGRAWLFQGRFHLYEGLPVDQVVLPVSLLAAAGASTFIVTCAAGGLLEEDRPGDFSLIVDHLNLTGADPVRAVPPERREPEFLDVQEAYDRRLADVWRLSARDTGVPLRDGVLAAVRGPSYETPAEIRMLRAIGADLVSMSTVPEVLAARYRGLRVAAIACIANRGAGVGSDSPIRHTDVVRVVARAVEAARGFFGEAIDGTLRLARLDHEGPADG